MSAIIKDLSTLLNQQTSVQTAACILESCERRLSDTELNRKLIRSFSETFIHQKRPTCAEFLTSEIALEALERSVSRETSSSTSSTPKPFEREGVRRRIEIKTPTTTPESSSPSSTRAAPPSPPRLMPSALPETWNDVDKQALQILAVHRTPNGVNQ